MNLQKTTDIYPRRLFYLAGNKHQFGERQEVGSLKYLGYPLRDRNIEFAQPSKPSTYNIFYSERRVTFRILTSRRYTIKILKVWRMLVGSVTTLLWLIEELWVPKWSYKLIPVRLVHTCYRSSHECFSSTLKCLPQFLLNGLNMSFLSFFKFAQELKKNKNNI